MGCAMGKTSITNELIYETLKLLRTELSELRVDTHGVKEEIFSLRMIMDKFIKADAQRRTV